MSKKTVSRPKKPAKANGAPAPLPAPPPAPTPAPPHVLRRVLKKSELAMFELNRAVRFMSPETGDDDEAKNAQAAIWYAIGDLHEAIDELSPFARPALEDEDEAASLAAWGRLTRQLKRLQAVAGKPAPRESGAAEGVSHG